MAADSNVDSDHSAPSTPPSQHKESVFFPATMRSERADSVVSASSASFESETGLPVGVALGRVRTVVTVPHQHSYVHMLSLPNTVYCVGLRFNNTDSSSAIASTPSEVTRQRGLSIHECPSSVSFSFRSHSWTFDSSLLNQHTMAT